MKPIIAFALLPAIALANPLLISVQSDPIIEGKYCEEGLNYCGYILIENKGYPAADLRRACARVPDTTQALFHCGRHNAIGCVGSCDKGCNVDTCNVRESKVNGKVGNVQIEL